MSTRSWIGIIKDNGEVDYIYCHSDGYISYVGAILNECYSSREKVNKLISLGDTSTLEPMLTHCGRYENSPFSTEESVKSLLRKFASNCMIEYLYLYGLNGEWIVYISHVCSGGKYEVKLLKDAVKEEE